MANGFFRIDCAVGFNINNQLVQVGPLFDACTVYIIGDAADRLNEASSCRLPITLPSLSSVSRRVAG